MNQKSKDRFVEIDLLRGVAVLGMIVYHFFYIGNFYGFFNINFDTIWWLIAARFVQITFLILVGVSMSISRSRSPGFYVKQLRRAFIVFAYAMCITFATWVFVPDRVIMIGILHLIALSILVLSVLVRRGFLLLFLAGFAFLFGLAIENMAVPHSLLLNIIGFASSGFYALDYFPIFPWISGPLFGAFLGGLIYRNGQRRFNFTVDNLIGRLILWLGRNALVVYVVHLAVLAVVANLLKFL